VIVPGQPPVAVLLIFPRRFLVTEPFACCPSCQAWLQVDHPLTEGQQLRCSRCGSDFAYTSAPESLPNGARATGHNRTALLSEEAAASLPSALPAREDNPEALPKASAVSKRTASRAEDERDRPRRTAPLRKKRSNSVSILLLAGAMVGILGLVSGVGIYAYWKFHDETKAQINAPPPNNAVYKTKLDLQPADRQQPPGAPQRVAGNGPRRPQRGNPGQQPPVAVQPPAKPDATPMKEPAPAKDVSTFGTLERDEDQVTFTCNDKATDADLANLKNVAGLTHLYLSDAQQITDAGLAHLKGLTQLTDLDLEDLDKITDAGLVHLAGLEKLKMLNLRNTHITHAGLAHVKGLTSLEVLHLDGVSVGDAGLAHLAGLTKLTYLSLTRTGITDAGLKHLARLTSLKELQLAENELNGTGLIHLAGSKELNNLNLQGNHVNDDGLAGIKHLKSLQALYLEQTDVTDAGLAHLAGLKELSYAGIDGLKGIKGPGLHHFESLPQLRALNLHGTGVTDAGLEGVKALTALQGLTLPETITDAGFVHLAGLTELQDLGMYNLKGLKGPGLVHLKKLSKLMALDLTTTGVTDAGLASLREVTQLQSLRLPPAITDAGLVHIAGLRHLTNLELYDTQITDAGLVQLKGSSDLQSLSLSSTKVTDAGLVHLEGLSNLRMLSLDSTAITNVGLGTLKKFTHLEYLGVTDTYVKAAGIKQLRKDLPNLQVNPDGEKELPVPDPTVRRKYSAAEWEAEVLKSTAPVLVDFWAPWCGPCRQMAPTVAAIGKDYKVRKVNVDVNEELSKQYKITSIPTLMIFKDGKVVEQYVGVTSEEALREVLAKASKK
jgi:internalin A